MAEITDLLKLNYSQSFDIQGMQEADINLSLSPAVPAAATVYGTVTDGTNPLPNATVKLFDSQGVPYRQVLTDTEGAYAFTNVPAGTYTVAAACAGHLMSPGAGLTLTGGDSLQVPLVCAPETTLSLGAIAGLVTSTGLEGILPVAGATITLRDLTGAAVASTASADDGEFVFYDVADGVYSLLATADGYLVTAPIAVTITRGSIANVAVTMVLDSRTYSGTVSGIIRGSNGAPVSGCFVGLYAVTGEAPRASRVSSRPPRPTPRANTSSAASPAASISSRQSSPHKPRTAKARGHLPALFYSLRCAKRV